MIIKRIEYAAGKWANAKNISCGCCNSCWSFIDGPLVGSCLAGGPFAGYLEVSAADIDKTLKRLDKKDLPSIQK